LAGRTLASLSVVTMLACDAAEQRSTAADALPDALPDADSQADHDAIVPTESPLLATLRESGGSLAYDLTITFQHLDEFQSFPVTPVSARLVVEGRPERPEAPFELTVFRPGLCNRAAPRPAFAEVDGLSFVHDLSIPPSSDPGAETLTLLAGFLRVGEPDGVLTGEARVERYLWLCDTDEFLQTTVTLRAVPEHTAPVARVARRGALPPFPRYEVVLDERSGLGGPYGVRADGVLYGVVEAGDFPVTGCGPGPRRSSVPLPWGAEVQVSVPELTDAGGTVAPARNLPLGRVVPAPAAPFAPSFEADDLSGFAVLGQVELLGAESSLPADDGPRRVRARGEVPWALAFELDVPAEPMARLDFSVRTLMGDQDLGSDTATPPSPASLVILVGLADGSPETTTQTVALPVPAFDTSMSAERPVSVPLGDFAGRRVVVQLEAADTCAADTCGGSTCTDVLLDGLYVRP
jgi:hypothetical protein